MARRWRRGSKGGDADPADVPAPSRDGRDDDDLESRLGPPPSAYRRPPTADELRAAFSRKPHDAEDAAPPPSGGDFASRYPTESLFVSTPIEPEAPPEPAAVGEDRSRPTGDYYYDPEDAWGVLGLEPGSAWKDIAAAHRRLAMAHHPDRLLDATAEEREASEATMREVNVAYNVLRRITGH